jgi:hypothetical protein
MPALVSRGLLFVFLGGIVPVHKIHYKFWRAFLPLPEPLPLGIGLASRAAVKIRGFQRPGRDRTIDNTDSNGPF